jgi:hypothetical protein
MSVSRFRLLVRAVLLSSAPMAAAACSSNTTDMPERAPCIDLTASNRYGALTLAPGVDGIAFATRPQTASSFGAPVVTPAERIASLGTPCAGASNRGECERKVGELLHDATSTGWIVNVGTCGGCQGIQFSDLSVITKGDDVRLATFDDLGGAIAPIDTRDEAANWLLLKGGQLDCGSDNNVRPESDGWTFKKSDSSCSGAEWETFAKITRTGNMLDMGRNEVSSADNGCIEGRRPSTLAPTGSGASWLASASACFAEIAHMEAAAVLAFDDLDKQLRALGAPWGLLMRVARAKSEEIEHAALTSALARRFGARPQAPRVGEARDVHAPDALLRLALENAVEGCVREAYGALVAAFQASHAEDAAVRAAFARIAVDEAEHAELSFDLDAWLATRLSPLDRAHVERAKAQAWSDLATACNIEPAREVVRIAGMPTAAEARGLLAQLRTELRSAA